MDRFSNRLESFCYQLNQEMSTLRELSQLISSVSVSMNSSFSMNEVIENSKKVSAFRFLVREILPVKERILKDAILLVTCPEVIRDGELKKLEAENDAMNARFMSMFGDSLKIETTDFSHRKS